MTPTTHYHIRWFNSKLDWQAFRFEEEATTEAERLKGPDESYALEVYSDGECPRCIETGLKTAILGSIPPTPVHERPILNPYEVFAYSPHIPELLASMIEATSADFGNVQLLDSSRPGLRIVAHKGFGPEFLHYFETVCTGKYSCGTAMKRQSRILVSDILTDPLFEDAPTQAVMLQAKVRACQSSALFDKFGSFVGVCSTHFQQPQRFDNMMWKRADDIVSHFATSVSASI